MTDNRAFWRDAAVLLIDHQVGTMSWVKSIPFEEMKRNALMLAKTARILRLPVVLTSSMEDHAQGPLLSELAEILPQQFQSRIQRAGIVNAMFDDQFAAAVKATGRRTLIVAGVTNDVCTVYPVLTLLEAGYEVLVVADAGGSPGKTADDLSLDRMQRAGATLLGTNQLLAGLAGDWSTPEGVQIVEVIGQALQA
ncbi:isochorismatase hydrolase protein [Alcanivorax xiamenensis]|uniref:Isochorismatase hydrolase protein n=1 Tax=Alcanivorax xiamenensis TaxID=1177156 RepID=A0ABQ6Y629_9GAMM|nr:MULTISPECIES: isochorismatase family protein [Alcanivorax]KAF0804754.1 isochorismatase hydrolase protein [Alcanivorax xiamenensis]